MANWVIGVVNQGSHISGMSIVSLKLTVDQVQAEIRSSDANHTLRIQIITDDAESIFCNFAKSLNIPVRIKNPSEWPIREFPSMSNGSYATYWKFDLINACELYEILIYVDADAFVLRNIKIDALLDRLEASNMRRQQDLNSRGSLLMVPSVRPVLERIGYVPSANPFHYFNAGVIIGMFKKGIDFEELERIYKRDFFGDSRMLIWHDQDLLNSYFLCDIDPLPLRYNVSSGMLRRENLGITRLNYLGKHELRETIIAHASGSALFSRKRYSFREIVIQESKKLLRNPRLPDGSRRSVEDFVKKIEVGKIRNGWQFLIAFFGLSRRPLIKSFDGEVESFRSIPRILFIRVINVKKLLRKVRHRNPDVI